MRFQMAKNSLFAILLRSPWWASASLALAVALVAFALLPDNYRLAGALSGFPFLVIAALAAWRQRQLPSAARIEQTSMTQRDVESFSVFDAQADVARKPGVGGNFPQGGGRTAAPQSQRAQQKRGKDKDGKPGHDSAPLRERYEAKARVSPSSSSNVASASKFSFLKNPPPK